jgi:hypothetical protein
MFLRSLHRRLTGWTALVAVLLATLAPTLMQGLAAADGARWGALCVSAADRSDGNAGPASGDAQHAQAGTHCPLCTLQQLGHAPPPTPSAAPLLAAGGHRLPVAPLTAPVGGPAWRNGQARAPPQFSIV